MTRSGTSFSASLGWYRREINADEFWRGSTPCFTGV
jgi:hypothetical protein